MLLNSYKNKFTLMLHFIEGWLQKIKVTINSIKLNKSPWFYQNFQGFHCYHDFSKPKKMILRNSTTFPGFPWLWKPWFYFASVKLEWSVFYDES